MKDPLCPGVMSNFRKSIFILLLSVFNGLVPACTYGQEVSPLFHHFSTEDGLPSSEVYVAKQDHLGNMWFGTDRGIARYDGYEFRTFTSRDGLSDNTIFKLQEDEKGRMWMLTYSGRLFYIENNVVRPFVYNRILTDHIQNKVPADFFVDQKENVSVTIIGSGIMRVSNTGSVSWNCRYEDARESNFQIEEVSPGVMLPSVYSPYETTGSIAVKWKREGISSLYPLHVRFSNRFLCMPVSRNNILFGLGRNLFEINGDSCILRQSFPGHILNLFSDSQQQVWLSSENGVFVYRSGDFSNATQHYLENGFVTSVLEDHEGGYWFTTLNNGVYYTPGYGIKGIKFREILLQKPVSLTTDLNSAVYAGYWSGALVRINGADPKIVRVPELNLTEQPVVRLSAFRNDSKIYMSQFAPGYLKDEQFHPFKVRRVLGIKTGFIRRYNGSIVGAGSGTLFASSGDSLLLMCNTDQRINCISESPDHRLLIGSNTGVYLVNEQTGKTTLYHRLLEKMRVDDMGWMEDCLVLATKGKGLVVLRKDTLIFVNEESGLCSDLINKISVQGEQVWCATNKGVGHVTFLSDDKTKFSVVNIQNRNGLLSDEINDIAVLEDTVYVVANSGISFFNTQVDFVNHTPPFIHITDLRVNNAFAGYTDNMEFRSHQNNIHIGFNGISFRSRGKMAYTVELTNGKDTLSSNTNNREVEFLSLRPGKYIFSVSAMNPTGIWSSHPATFHFTILPPWWQTPWFLIIILLLLSGALWILYKNRLLKFRRQFEVEQKQASLQLTAMRAQMNPHFIFNVMNSIRNFMQHNDMKSAEKYLTSFSKLVRYTLDNSQVQEVSLQEELNALRTYSELEMQRFENGFDFEIECEPGIDLEEFMLPSLLLQPFVENSIKHGISKIEGRGKIKITLKRTGEGVLISIEDNGTGFDTSSNWNQLEKGDHVSRGTSLTFERINAFNKAYGRTIKARIVNLNTPDGHGGGTRVEVEI